MKNNQLPVLLLLFALALGCDRTVVEPVPKTTPNTGSPPSETSHSTGVQDPAQSSSKDALVVATEAEQWISEQRLPWDAWYLQYLGGNRVGYYHVNVQRGDKLNRIRRKSVFEASENGKTTQFRIELESLEYPNGKLASFTERTLTDEGFREISGQLIGNRMNLTRESKEKVEKTRLNWISGTWGVLDIQSILLAHPMRPGEKRAGKVFVPSLGEILSVELTAAAPEATPLPDGTTRELVPVATWMTRGESVHRSQNWINDRGEILKSVTLDGTVASTFRVSQEVAARVAGEYQLKAQLTASGEYSGNPTTPDSRSATYIVNGSRIHLYAMWSKTVRQTVRSVNALTTEVTIHREASEAFSEIPQDTPSEDHLATSELVQAKDPALSAFAAKLLNHSEPLSPREIAERLTQGVFESTRKLPLSEQIAGALETHRRRQGDAIAHAILLTALLRNQGIPARVAGGIQVDASNSRTRFYMWTEAWVDQRWLSLDAMSGQETGLDCIKMSDTPMNDANPYEYVLPIVDQLQQIKMELKTE